MNKKNRFKLNLNKNRGEYSLFSIPQTNQYQKITDLFFQPKIYEIINENKFGNKIVVFRLNDVLKNVTLNFKHQSRRVEKKITERSNIYDYKKEIFLKYNYLLKPDRFVNGKDKVILKIAKNIINNEINLIKIIRKFYNYSLEYLTYGKPINGLYSYRQTVEERITDCGGFSTFLISLLQSLNIPARLVVGFLIKNNLKSKFFSLLNAESLTFNDLSIHAWLEVLLPDESWFPLDPSIEWRREKGLTKRQGGFGFIPDDRLVVSFGQDFNFKIDSKLYKIDLLQNPIYK